MSLTVDLEQPIDSFSNGGNKPVQPFHAYCGEITAVEEKNGYINISVKTTDAKSGQYDALSTKVGGPYEKQTVGRWAKAVIQSNPKLAEFGAQTSVDMTKWVGLAIGLVYVPKQDKGADDKYHDTKWCKPKFVCATGEVANHFVAKDKYEAWLKEFWSRPTHPQTSDVGEPPSGTPTFGEDDLPF